MLKTMKIQMKPQTEKNILISARFSSCTSQDFEEQIEIDKLFSPNFIRFETEIFNYL
jgi:hypothetical protein